MIRSALAGLRGRLLLAFVATSAVTLVVAAAITLSPLQSQLREQGTQQLEDTTEDLRAEFRDKLKLGAPKDVRDAAERAKRDPRAPRVDVGAAARDRRESELITIAYELRDRTGGARVFVTDGSFTNTDDPPKSPAFLFDTGGRTSLREPMTVALEARRVGVSQLRLRDDVATFAMPVYDNSEIIGVVVAQRTLAEATSTASLVRNRLLAAAGVGLAVAIGLGLALSSTLTRRLGRLQRSALRITQEGPEAPAPVDRGRDEVGDLARAIGRMQEELRRQEAARRSFVSTASHELRTPLTMLSGTMELLDEDLQGGVDLEDAREQVASARVELRRLSVLASELLDLSRLDAAVQLRSEPVELGEIARAVAAEFELHASERATALDVEAPGPCWGIGDPAACARVVRILIDNALRYAPAGEPILISTHHRFDTVIVRVADRGPGVPPEEREHIFERFHRGKATSEVSGFGLGLAIGRELTERMNGTLVLEDSEHGAQFAFTLPVAGEGTHVRSPVVTGADLGPRGDRKWAGGP
ncbi:HAMP domain-containing histidine kinase [Solirubrobacter sp. CPCC 204708]|uniref:histidine kinase n=1 Tax=Solirubrobacter deserti TaxID=2282478 RepID=A0ABT4RKY1_9ACTN|nr:HAMP domain-containing sensor histidine kinase [Solirubrobacter deserti]MBE2319107.1 HAMP domain-containing histidine kinase [Solirubrobacter deserti]MDA0139186.1 HAMP domain-containing histidine kinase [Solirubrobacter deserti]